MAKSRYRVSVFRDECGYGWFVFCRAPLKPNNTFIGYGCTQQQAWYDLYGAARARGHVI
jgi:hypothetical protein